MRDSTVDGGVDAEEGGRLCIVCDVLRGVVRGVVWGVVRGVVKGVVRV